MTRNHLVLLGDSTLDNERPEVQEMCVWKQLMSCHPNAGKYLDVDMGDQPVGMQLARRLGWSHDIHEVA